MHLIILTWDGFPYQSPLGKCLLISKRNKVFQLERVALLFFYDRADVLRSGYSC